MICDRPYVSARGSVGAEIAESQLAMMVGLAFLYMNSHDAIFVGELSGPLATAVAALLFATHPVTAIFSVWRHAVEA
ncbi:MAG: hypothetical protein AAGA12_09590 [Pseudomonadota bacterium]